MNNKIVPGLVSVIMSNYNTPEEYLRESIESILCQTYENFEFIIVDDCSTDSSLSVIESYTDSRIKIIRNEENLGITKSLNRALEASLGEFIARMDADDVSLPERFERQVSYLRENEDVIVCSTWANFIGDWQKKHTHGFSKNILPEREDYKINLLFGNYPNMVHPTVMMRASMLHEHNLRYNENYRFAQDYRLWVNCINYGELKIIPEVHFNYRVHGGSVSVGKAKMQSDCVKGIVLEQLNKLELYPNEKQAEIHTGLLMKRLSCDSDTLDWIKKIITQNKKLGVYNHIRLKKILWTKWAEAVYFEIASRKGIGSAIKAVMTLPPSYYGSLITIFKQRKGSGK